MSAEGARRFSPNLSGERTEQTNSFIVVCILFVLISCIFLGKGPLAGATGATYADMIANAGISKTNVMQMAFGSIFGKGFGNIFVAICLFFFAFSTIISWNFFGKLNAQYLTGNKKAGVLLYAVISIAFIFTGSILSNDLVWELTDFFNYLMVLPNAIALIALGKVVAKNARK